MFPADAWMNLSTVQGEVEVILDRNLWYIIEDIKKEAQLGN
jgi:hypothetical protein